MLSNKQIDSDVRMSIAIILGERDDRSVIPSLLQLLFDQQIDPIVRERTAVALGNLGGSFLIPDLLQFFSNPKINWRIRRGIAKALGKLANDESTVRTLAELLQTSDIADDIHQALWKVSRQAGVRAFMIDGPAAKEIEIVKWEDEPQAKDKPSTSNSLAGS